MGGSGSKSKKKNSSDEGKEVADGMPDFSKARKPSLADKPMTSETLKKKLSDSALNNQKIEETKKKEEDKKKKEDDKKKKEDDKKKKEDNKKPQKEEEKPKEDKPVVVSTGKGLGYVKPQKKTEREEDNQKMFAAPKGPERSKIWKALNPDKLYYESARERAEQEDEKNVLDVRGGLGVSGVDYTVMRDDEGNIIEEEDDDEEEEEVDLNNLPDFDPETLEELKKNRAARAEQEKAKQDKLRKAYEEKKRKENEIRQKELEQIRKKEEALKKDIPTETANFVSDAQKRIEAETAGYFKDFSFKAD